MADGTKIEWTDATWNPITGCSVVSAGCKHCYAMKLAGTRLKHVESRKGLTVDTKAGPVWTGEVRFNEAELLKPLSWKKPRRIFVCAHGDLFHEAVPDEWIDRVFAVMALAPQHTFQVLTKRPTRMRAYIEALHGGQRSVSQAAHRLRHGRVNRPCPHVDLVKTDAPLPNVWLGVSVEDQETADLRIPILLDIPAALRWISAEPLLGPIDLKLRRRSHGFPKHIDRFGNAHGLPLGLHWVVAGGESGPNARPMHPDWARSLRDQCVAAGVPFLFKQWGEWIAEGQQPAERRWLDIDRRRWVALGDGDNRYTLTAAAMHPVGKKAAGRLLDGVEHNGFPEPR